MRDDLVLSMVDYLSRGFPEMTKETLQRAVEKGLNQKGENDVGIREYIKEESWKEGRQEKERELVLNMLKEKLDFSVISKATGLSEEEIKNLKNGS